MKTYEATVRSRRRITIPYDCWLDCNGMKTLTIKENGILHEWEPGVGMTKNMSYRVTVNFSEGDRIELIPNKKGKLIVAKKLD